MEIVLEKTGMARKKTFLHACLIAFLLCLPSQIFAHPHMYFTSSQEFVWKGVALSGCWIEWKFDSFFSADIIHGFDKNADGSFNESETREVYENAFLYLEHYYYFTFIRQGSMRSNPEEVQNFSVSQKNGKVNYRFFIDLSKTIPGEIALAVYDYTFFCDITYPEKDAVHLTYDPSLVSPQVEIVENKEFPVYYNPLGAVDDTTIYYTWKKGLQTFYPREIRIRYGK